MTIRLEPKRTDEKRRYRHDWSAFLGEDTIASQTTTSPDVTISGAAIDTNGNQAIEYTVEGGTNGEVATITQSIVTAAGDHETETFVIPIRDADEPLTLSEVKDQLGILDTSRDGLLLGYIGAARRYAENYTDHILVRRTVTDVFDCWGYNYLQLSKRPVISVDSVTYTDANGADADYADFTVSAGRVPARIFAGPSGRPTIGRNGNIRVEYTAGYANGQVPEEARQAILMLIAHWFVNREAVAVSNVAAVQVPLATTALLDSFKAQVA